MKKTSLIIASLTLCGLFASCNKPEKESGANGTEGGSSAKEEEHEHEHEEISLGTFDVGGMSIEAAQGHGNVEAGKEGHLVIKLPYNDKGETTVRAWIGTEDRTLSSVGKGDYAPSHDDYDIHAVAPNPLPDGSKWWLEVEKPDGTKTVGSIPLLKDIPKSN